MYTIAPVVEKIRAKLGYCYIEALVMPRRVKGLRGDQAIDVKIAAQYQCWSTKRPVLKIIEDGYVDNEGWYIHGKLSLLESQLMNENSDKLFCASPKTKLHSPLFLYVGDIQDYVKDFVASEMKFIP